MLKKQSLFKTLLMGLSMSLIAHAAQATNTKQTTQVVALLKSLETGVSEPASVINPNKYIQHNLSVADGVAGFAKLVKSLPKNGVKVHTVRVFEDGDFVVAHTEYDFFGPKIGFDVFRFEKGKIVEHWDNLQEKAPALNPSGRSMIDGMTEVTDLDKTEANKALVKEFADTVLSGGKFEKASEFLLNKGEGYLQHNPMIPDTLNGLAKAFGDMAKQGITLENYRVNRVLGQGNFVLLMSDGLWAGKPVAFYDLFRVENGKIAEHWDTIQDIPARKEWKNSNGKF